MNVDVFSIAFIGLGEAASTIISGWGDHRNKQIQAFDIKLQESDLKEEIISRASKLNIGLQFSLKDLVSDADFIFSTVTADQALHVAVEASPSKTGFQYSSCVIPVSIATPIAGTCEHPTPAIILAINLLPTQTYLYYLL